MVRAANISDREAVGRLWSALMDEQGRLDDRFAASHDAGERWDNDYPGWLHSGSRKLYVAEQDGTVCGFATVERWGPPPIYKDRPGLYIDELYVDPDHRGQGHGRSLVDAIRAWGREVGAHELRVGVLAGNKDAQAFWKEVGGVEVSRSFALPLDHEDEGEMHSSSRLGFRL